MKSYYYNTNIGYLTFVEEDNCLIELSFGKNIKGVKKETPLILECKKQIEEYLNKKRNNFNVSIKLIGTDFQIKVWNELLKISYGKTISYEDLAMKIKSKNYARAVGMANNKNPIAIIVPCHRVIGKKGDLVGYAEGLDIKQKLLDLERK